MHEWKQYRELEKRSLCYGYSEVQCSPTCVTQDGTRESPKSSNCGETRSASSDARSSDLAQAVDYIVMRERLETVEMDLKEALAALETMGKNLNDSEQEKDEIDLKQPLAALEKTGNALNDSQQETAKMDLKQPLAALESTAKTLNESQQGTVGIDLKQALAALESTENKLKDSEQERTLLRRALVLGASAYMLFIVILPEVILRSTAVS